jgi:hypothetical protein
MFSEGGFKVLTTRASARVASLPWRSFTSSSASFPASRAILPLLVAEAAALALAAGSGKIPAFLFTAVRALLTF